jgi:cell division protein FtsB
MRIRRSVSRIFRYSVFPAVSVAVVAYFGYHAYWGERGYVALHATETRLVQEQVRLDGIVGERKRLEHRIALLKAADPDLVGELARTQLMDGAPDQVAVPRGAK